MLTSNHLQLHNNQEYWFDKIRLLQFQHRAFQYLQVQYFQYLVEYLLLTNNITVYMFFTLRSFNKYFQPLEDFLPFQLKSCHNIHSFFLKVFSNCRNIYIFKNIWKIFSNIYSRVVKISELNPNSSSQQ